MGEDGELDVGRDYRLFGIMAGVRLTPHPLDINGYDRAIARVNGEAIYEIGVAKDFPPDLSRELRSIINVRFEHTPSWATLDELKFWLKLHRSRGGTFYGWGEIRDRMVKLEKKDIKTRLIFFFDS